MPSSRTTSKVNAVSPSPISMDAEDSSEEASADSSEDASEDASEDEDTEDNNDMQSDGLTNEEAGLE